MVLFPPEPLRDKTREESCVTGEERSGRRCLIFRVRRLAQMRIGLIEYTTETTKQCRAKVRRFSNGTVR